MLHVVKVGVQLKCAEYQILLTDAMVLTDYLPTAHSIGRDISLRSALDMCDGASGNGAGFVRVPWHFAVGIFMEMPNIYLFITKLKGRIFDKIEPKAISADLGLLLTQS